MHTWTDNPATPAVHVRATHINELRSNVNAARTAAGLSAYNWTDGATLDSTKHTRAIHFTELRSALQDLWTHASMGNIPNWSVGNAPSTSREVSARDINDLRDWYDLYDPESIIGAQWTNNSRNWNSKSGWDVELVYATSPSPGFDLSTTGTRVQQAHQAGRNVLVRVDYAPGQSVPPDDASRTTYMNFLQTMCTTAAYNQNAWGYIIGNEYNLSAENGGGTPITPAWYARVFNGYSAPTGDTGNACQVIKTYQPPTHVLVGPVAPWAVPPAGADSPGTPAVINMAWLNYFNGVCEYVQAGANAKGLSVDGLAIHAYGRTGTDGTANGGANEPHTDVQGSGWATGAWAGFTVYKNWRDILNNYFPSVPVWITETNTHTDAPSSESYPSGWYLQALAEIHSAGSRFWSACWFPDEDYGSGWPNDALTNPVGNCAQGNNDFNSALTNTTY